MGWTHWDTEIISSQLLKTGQVISYHADDDGDLEKGVSCDYSVLTLGQYSGTVNVIINGKTHAASNACVQDEKTGLMWHREVVQADIGPADDGKLFWDQYTLTHTVTFTAADGKITADAGIPFSTIALCAGRKFTVAGSGAGNDGTYTVSAITTSVITTVEGVSNEASISIDFASVDDLIWDLVDQANSGGGLAGYTDWRIPNKTELCSILVEKTAPTIDATIFPSTPTPKHFTSTTYAQNSLYAVAISFFNGFSGSESKQGEKWYTRLVRN